MSLFSISVFVFVMAGLLLVTAVLGVMSWLMSRDEAKPLLAMGLAAMGIVVACCATVLADDALVKGNWCWSGRWEST